MAQILNFTLRRSENVAKKFAKIRSVHSYVHWVNCLDLYSGINPSRHDLQDAKSDLCTHTQYTVHYSLIVTLLKTAQRGGGGEKGSAETSRKIYRVIERDIG